ncbi:MAG: DUF2384 domain-containing protein [Gluconacetobacter diazotrophicus]|nr:DUF2384 domain-containing protein [Gluconacetobacter diazotrophicus]
MSLAPLQPPGAIPTGTPGSAEGPVTADEARAACRAVLALFDRWRLDASARCILLGGISERTLQRWQNGQPGSLNRDAVFRLGCLLGIHKALRYLFPDPARGYDWIRRPNTAFGGLSALDVMLHGDALDLHRVRACLDAERGGW